MRELWDDEAMQVPIREAKARADEIQRSRPTDWRVMAGARRAIEIAQATYHAAYAVYLLEKGDPRDEDDLLR